MVNFLRHFISITYINKSMQKDMARDNHLGLHYNTAKILRLLLDFEPIELVNDGSKYFNSTSIAEELGVDEKLG